MQYIFVCLNKVSENQIKLLKKNYGRKFLILRVTCMGQTWMWLAGAHVTF